MHMIAIANHCQKWLLTKMCMVNSFFEILCITSNTTPDSLVQLMWPMSLLLFKIKFKSQMLRFFLNLHGLLVKHCVNLCPHQQSYLIIFSMTWQLSQSLTWEARRRKKKVKGENTGCGHVSVSDWECQRSHGMQRSRCLAFTESALNELINIHWPALANVPSDEQNKVTEVAHFTRGEKAGWEEWGRKWAMQRKWAELIRGGRFRGRKKKRGRESAKRSKHQKGKASRPVGVSGVYYELKVRRIKHAGET